MPPQRSHRLVVSFVFRPFPFVVGPGLGYLPNGVGYRGHHRRLGSLVYLSRAPGAVELPRSFVQRTHPQVQGQTGLRAEPLQRPYLPRKLRSRDHPESWGAPQPLGKLRLTAKPFDGFFQRRDLRK